MIVFEKTTTSFFSYLTTLGADMLNSAPFSTRRRSYRSINLLQCDRWRHSFSLRADETWIDKFEKNYNYCLYLRCDHALRSFPLYKSINPSRTMSRPHYNPRFLLRAERWNNALRRDWLVLRLGAGPTPAVNFYWSLYLTIDRSERYSPPSRIIPCLVNYTIFYSPARRRARQC